MSEIRATTISDEAGTGPIALTGQSAAKAWVNFNGTGTIATRDSFNVASLTDNESGDYTVNLSSSMINSLYSAQVTSQETAANDRNWARSASIDFVSSTSFSVFTFDSRNPGGTTDVEGVHSAIHGDLA